MPGVRFTDRLRRQGWALLLLAPSVFGGSSIRLTNGFVHNDSFPARATGQPWRVEFYLHDWNPNITGNALVADIPALGLNVQFINANGIRLQLYNTRETGGSGVCMSTISDLADKAVYVRFQHDPATRTDFCEMWDRNGKRVFQYTSTYASENGGSNGVQAGGPWGEDRCLGFLRVHSTLLPLNSRTPITSDNTNALLHWRFDGSLNDASGGNYKGSMSGGSANYLSTPFQGLVAVIKTANAPVWTNWVSLRAGHPAQLDGRSSFSQADASSNVTCSWQLLEGPSKLSWKDQANSCTPTVTGLVFGDYHFQLTITDATGQKAVASEHIGAVAMDDKGVVIPPDQKVTEIFGPMIAFGRNPWGYADERALTATRLRSAAYQSAGLNTPVWELPQPGTVKYVFNGVGMPAGSAGTSLCAPLSANGTTVDVCDASKLDLSALPARIVVGPLPLEEIRICAASGTTGRQTLTVCYDGRAFPGTPDGYRGTARDWNQGTVVGQGKISGTGTSFLTTICPAGAGPSGVVSYSSGSIQLTPGSNTAAGSGANWTNANGVTPGQMVRVSATHGGAPFTFLAYISSLQDPAHLNLSRAYPANADAGTFSYQIVGSDHRNIVLYYTRADGSEGKTYFQTSGCESDTAVYSYIGHDIGSLNGTQQNGKKYSYIDGGGYVGAFGPNFYGEGLAHRAFYYRSGLKQALEAANVMDDNFAKSPQVAGGDIGGIPLLMGGGVIGSFVDAILSPGRVSWTDLRGLARMGSIGGAGCNDYDTRDSGYLGAWLTLAANYDPDPAQRTIWKNNLLALLARDQNCQGSEHSWAQGFLYNNSSPALTVTNGSAVVTGANLPPSLCYGIAQGTVQVTSGSASFSGTGLVNGNKIVITGSRNGQPFTGAYAFQQTNGTSGSLGALWPGDSGTATYIIENSDNLSAIGGNQSDVQLKKNWSCIWNSATQITLHRPWDGPSSSQAHMYSYALAGYGQQPYMLGIKITAMKWASYNPDPAIAAGYAALLPQAAAWVQSTGYDPVTQGLFYGRQFEFCEPAATPPPGSSFNWRTPGCHFGLDPASIRASRVLTAEASSAIRAYYEANSTPAARDWGDRAYGSVWGYAPYTTGGVYSDANYVRDENSDSSLGAYKWTGFFFGMGMGHQWPAVRLGGLGPLVSKNLPINFALPAEATQLKVIVTQPNGVEVTQTCSSSPCAVSVDARQGSMIVKKEYRNANGKGVADDSKEPASVIADLP